MSKQKLAKLKRLLNIKQQQLEIKRQDLANAQIRRDAEIRKADLLKRQRSDVFACEMQSPGGVTELIQIQQCSQKLQQLLEQQLEIVNLANNHHEARKIEITKLRAGVKAWEKYVAKLEAEIAVSIAKAEMVLADDSYLMNQTGGLK